MTFDHRTINKFKIEIILSSRHNEMKEKYYMISFVYRIKNKYAEIENKEMRRCRSRIQSSRYVGWTNLDIYYVI
jgi:hypothetical protein